MTINVVGAANAPVTQYAAKSAKRQIAAPSSIPQPAAVNGINGTVETNQQSGQRARFYAENHVPEPANKALGAYLSVQNNEKREQVQSLLGLDVYA